MYGGGGEGGCVVVMVGGGVCGTWCVVAPDQGTHFEARHSTLHHYHSRHTTTTPSSIVNIHVSTTATVIYDS